MSARVPGESSLAAVRGGDVPRDPTGANAGARGARWTRTDWIVLAVAIAAFAWDACRALDCAERSALEFATVTALGAGCAGALSFARSLRGRLVLADVVHPLAWLLPWQLTTISASVIGASAGISFVAIGFTCGWRALWSQLGRALRATVKRLDQPTLGILLVIGLAWLSHFEMPGKTEEPGLDASWHEVKAHELLNHWQTGVDTVFTYGPLGYFHPAPYARGLYWTKVVWWEIAFKLTLIAILVASVRRAGGTVEKTLFLMVVMVMLNGPDTFALTSVIAVSMGILHARRRPGLTAVLGFVCLALLGLVKFTWFMSAGIAVGWIVLERALASWRSGLRTLALYVLVVVTLWTLLGQSPLNLPRYVVTSWWIARGYNEAMTSIGPAKEVVLAYSIMSLMGTIALLQVLQRPRERIAWIGALMLCTGVFLALKSGFVRHGGNSIIFFDCAAVSSFLLPAFEPRTDRERFLRGTQATVRVACALCAIYGSALSQRMTQQMPDFFTARWIRLISEHTRQLSHPLRYRAELQHRRQSIVQANVLPRIRAAVKREPVDIFNSNQSLLLFNELNYRPRPVFQSYSAYTPELIELNARFLSGDRAPRFMLFEPESIDERLPGSQDGLALQVLMRDYRPIMSEAGILLLERTPTRTTDAADPRRLVLERSIHFGETLDLDEIYDADRRADNAAERDPAKSRRCYLIAMDIDPTLLGRLRTVLIKGIAPVMTCDVVPDPSAPSNAGNSGDSNEASTLHAMYRIVPGMLRTGVVVNPLLDTTDAWRQWYSGEPVPRITRFKVTTHPELESLFQPLIRVRVLRDDTLSTEVDPHVAQRLVYSMFSLSPEYVHASATVSHARVENLEVLLVHAPSELCFPVAAGAHTVRARYGFVPEAFDQDHTDGAGFSVVLRAQDGAETEVFRELIDKTSVNPRSPHELTIHVETPAAARLLFRADNGPKGDAACDWTYWTEISIEDAATGAATK